MEERICAVHGDSQQSVQEAESQDRHDTDYLQACIDDEQASSKEADLWNAAQEIKSVAGKYKKRAGTQGVGIYDFGPSHVHGQHHTSLPAIPNLLPKTGIGLQLRPAKLGNNSCIPPPSPEPLIPPPAGLREELIAQDRLRVTHPQLLINRLVYDCLQPQQTVHNKNEEESGEVVAEASYGEVSASERSSCCSNSRVNTPGAQGRSSSNSDVGSNRQMRQNSVYTLSHTSDSSREDVQELPQPRCSTPSLPPLPETAYKAAYIPTLQDPIDRVGLQPAGQRMSQPGVCRVSFPGTQNVNTCTASDNPCSSSYTRQFDYYPDLPCWYKLSGASDTTLIFESRFESGNLRRAIQVYPYEYDLVLRPDINTHRHTQWFFFSVSNVRPGVKYKINIINMQKPDSLYTAGLRPLVHSQLLMASKKIGWHRAGERIAYYPNTIKHKGKQYSTLSFMIQGYGEGDVLHISHCYPYTYTDARNHVKALTTNPDRQLFVQHSQLCYSLAGNPVDLLTITAPVSRPEMLKKRKGVVITGRIHPGESNASWMMKGLLDYLTGPSQEARWLRAGFVFKIVPMLNPDGVINGNYRCSLAGCDLNRVWNEPSKKLHPTVYAAKELIKSFMAEREVVLFCDLHSHSRKRDIFAYGCNKDDPDGLTAAGSIGGYPSVPTRLQDKLLPLLMYHSAPDLFSYPSCSFKVQKSKLGTGRVVGFKELGLVNSLTVEASFAGPSTGRWAGQHFTTFHLETMGAALLSALHDYCDAHQYGMSELLSELEMLHPPGQDAARRCVWTSDGYLVEAEDEDTDSDDNDSDSDVEGGGGGRGRSKGGQKVPENVEELLPEAAAQRRKSKRKEKAAQLRLMLKEQRAKAEEGIMACLPLMGVRSPAGSMNGADANGCDCITPGFLTANHATHHTKATTLLAALEYARNRGIYRGEALSWANSEDPLATATTSDASRNPGHNCSNDNKTMTPETRQTAPADCTAGNAAQDSSALLLMLDNTFHSEGHIKSHMAGLQTDIPRANAADDVAKACLSARQMSYNIHSAIPPPPLPPGFDNPVPASQSKLVSQRSKSAHWLSDRSGSIAQAMSTMNSITERSQSGRMRLRPTIQAEKTPGPVTMAVNRNILRSNSANGMPSMNRRMLEVMIQDPLISTP